MAVLALVRENVQSCMKSNQKFTEKVFSQIGALYENWHNFLYYVLSIRDLGMHQLKITHKNKREKYQIVPMWTLQCLRYVFQLYDIKCIDTEKNLITYKQNIITFQQRKFFQVSSMDKVGIIAAVEDPFYCLQSSCLSRKIFFI